MWWAIGIVAVLAIAVWFLYGAACLIFDDESDDV